MHGHVILVLNQHYNPQHFHEYDDNTSITAMDTQMGKVRRTKKGVIFS